MICVKCGNVLLNGEIKASQEAEVKPTCYNCLEYRKGGFMSADYKQGFNDCLDKVIGILQNHLRNMRSLTEGAAEYSKGDQMAKACASDLTSLIVNRISSLRR